MKTFSQLIYESGAVSTDSKLTTDDIGNYLSAANKQLTGPIKKILYLTQLYNLTTSEQLDEIKNARRGDIPKLVDRFSIPTNELEDLINLLSTSKKDLRMLPQYQTEVERNGIMQGRLTMNDLTIDLSNSQGKNAVVKMYTPMVMKIVNQYMGRSKMDRSSLISAGMAGLADAINNWKPEPDKNGKVVAFKTYAAYRIQQQILNDINTYGHTLSGTNWYASKEYGAALLDAISIDGLPRDENGDFKQDHIQALGVEDPKGDEAKSWDVLYKLLDRKFSQRDCDIFYRYMGLNGRKREKSKDIAKSYGMSEGNIRNSIINKIIKYLKTDKRANEILQDIMDMYTEHLMIDMFGSSKEHILETLMADDTYILLEEITRWNNKYIFKRAINDALTAINDPIIIKLLEGNFNTIDEHLKKSKDTIISFLSHMYPTEVFKNKTDVSLLEYMSEIQILYKKYK